MIALLITLSLIFCHLRVFFFISFRYRKEKADKKSQNELYFSSHTGKDAFVLDIKFERQLSFIQCISNADCLNLQFFKITFKMFVNALHFCFIILRFVTLYFFDFISLSELYIRYQVMHYFESQLWAINVNVQA